MNVLRFTVLSLSGLLFSFCTVHAQEGQPYYTQQPEVRTAVPSNAAGDSGITASPILQRPIQTPPKRVYQSGALAAPSVQNPAPVTDGRTLPPGYGAPFPTGLPIRPANGNNAAAAPSEPNRQNVQLYTGTSGTSVPQAQPASAQPLVGQQYASPPSSQPAPQYTQQPLPANNVRQTPPIPANPANPPINRQPVHVGRAAPENRVIPFFLTPEEGKELDEFLTRWEKYSEEIKRYDVDFNMFIYDATIPGNDLNKPYKTAFGFFKYSKPMRFVYSVEGEWVGNEKVKRSDDPKTANIFAEKIIIDAKSVFRFDYNAKNVLQINVPAEIIGRGIADSPLPLIFGAKAADMKRRFSMKMRTAEQNGTPLISLQAKPLLLEDQQEFTLIELLIEKNTFRAIGLKRYDINGKAFTVYQLQSPVINGNLGTILADLKTYFTPSIPRGWKHEVNDWAMDVSLEKQEQPVGLPAGSAPRIAEQRDQSQEIQLYAPIQ